MTDERMEAAAEWRSRKAEGLEAADEAAFGAWLTDADNALAYAQVERAWAAFEAPEATDSIQLRRLARETRLRVRRRRLNGVIGRIAAAVVLSVGVGMTWLAQQGAVYTNPERRPKVVALDDGSRLTLDAASTVRVHYTRERRHFELRKGQASFQVAHLPKRPFEVKVDDATVVALGTTFNIDRWGDGATITLLEGGVRVSKAGAPAVTLSPNQQVTLQGGRLSTVAQAAPQAVSAWRTGMLMFDDVRLGKALADVSRYSPHQVTLEDPSLADLRISGVFRADDPDAFYRSVAELHGLRATASPEGLTLRRP